MFYNKLLNWHWITKFYKKKSKNGTLNKKQQLINNWFKHPSKMNIQNNIHTSKDKLGRIRTEISVGMSLEDFLTQENPLVFPQRFDYIKLVKKIRKNKFI